jgi:Beta-galactosidase trimerisation domain
MRRRDFLQHNTVLLALAPLAGLDIRASRSFPVSGSKNLGDSPHNDAQPYVITGTPGWWEKEPLLIYEVIMFTMPGYSVSNNWQQNADPAVEAGDVAAALALQTHQTSIITGHLTNRFCYFKSPRFKENRRDYLEAYLRESRKAGFRTIVYFNVHAVKPEFGADQPDWRQIRFDGTPLDDIYGVETSFCVNSPWRDWVRDVCLDLCRYPIDGIFFDGPCLFAKCCYCVHCRKLYKESLGKEMPPKEAGRPETRGLARFQAESLRRFLEHSNTAIKSVRPDVLLYCNAGPREEPYYLIGRNNRVLVRSQDVLAAEGGFVYGELSSQPAWRVGSNAKYYQTQAGGKPTGVFMSPSHGPWISANLPDAELELAFVQAPVHGSGIWFSGFHWFREQPAFKKIAADFQFFSVHRDTYFGTRSRARTAIIWPADALNFYENPAETPEARRDREPVGSIHDEFNGFYDVMIKSRIPCDILDEESLRREGIGRYELLVLPNAACTGKEADARLREYVRDGGNIIASFETSLCDEAGGRQTDFGLADLFGARLLRSSLRPYPHFYFYRNKDWARIFAGVEADLLPAPLVSCEIAEAGAKAVSPFSIKFKGWDGSEILPSAFPAITANAFGKGRAVYLAGPFGEHYWKYKQPDIRVLLKNLLIWLAPPVITLENAPETIEVVHRETTDEREVVTLINYGGGLTRPFEAIEPVDDITVKLKNGEGSLQGKVPVNSRPGKTRARALKLDRTLESRREGEWLVVRLPRLEIFETIVFE